MKSNKIGPPSSPKIAESDLRTALDSALRENMPPVCAGLSVLFAIFALAHTLVLPKPVAIPMSIVALTTAILLLSLRIALGRRQVPADWAHPIGAAVAGLVLLNGLLHLYLTSEPQQTTNLLLLIIGCGFFFLSARWLALVLATTLFGWGFAVWAAPPSRSWLHFRFALLSATLLSVLVHGVRVRMFRRLESLRLQNELRKAELEASLTSAQQSEEKFRQQALIFDNIHDSVMIINLEGLIIDWNPAAERMFGYSKEEVLGKTPFGYPKKVLGEIPGAFRSTQNSALLVTKMAGSVKPDSRWFGEINFIRKDGTEGICETVVLPLRDEHGELVATIGVNRDITERKRAEEALLKNQSILSAVVEGATDAIFMKDLQGRYLLINSAGANFLGKPIEEIIGKDDTELFSPDLARQFMEDDRKVISSGEPQTFEGVATSMGITQTYLATKGVYRDYQGNIIGIIGVAHDITERKQAEDALRASEARTRAIIDNMLGGLITIDSRGIIELVNPAAEKIFGYKREELIGQHLKILVPESAGPDPISFLKSARQQALGRITEWEGRRKNGEVFPFELSLYLFETPEGLRLAGNIIDVSERREVDRLKKEFVSTVSHELRTPLTSIRGSLSLLAAGVLGELPEEAQEVVSIAERNSIRLISLINDILDIERLESGKMEMHFEDLPLASVLDRSIEAVAAFAEEQGIALEVSSTSATVFADGDRLVQVLVNLLSNAVKFSPRGSSITISTEEGPGWAEVRVKDRGRGIPAAYKETIFERFRQVETSDARQKGGTGLGLAICKAIIEQHNGSIGVESEEGKGSAFWFRIPLASSRPEILEKQVAKQVLVCHAEPDMRQYFETMLKKEGYEVLIADSAEEAWDILRRAEVSMAILDVALLGNSGPELVGEIRKDSRLKNLPLVMVDKKVLLSPKELSDNLAVFLSKPIQEEQLLAVIRDYLEKECRCDVLLADDDETLLNVMARQLSQEGIEVCTATTGREAVLLAQKKPPGLLVLDIGLPDGDGFDVVEALRREPRLKGIPLLIYTGRDLTGEQRGRLSLGPTRFLTKSKATDEEFRTLVIDLMSHPFDPRSEP